MNDTWKGFLLLRRSKLYFLWQCPYLLAAEEGLLRRALLTDAEIPLVEADVVPEFDGTAAMLRF